MRPLSERVRVTERTFVLEIYNNATDAEFRAPRIPGEGFDGDDSRILHMSYEDWAQMGYPETITVNIKPGDKLND